MTIADVLEASVADNRDGAVNPPKLVWRDQALTDAMVLSAAGHPYVRLQVGTETVSFNYYGTLDRIDRLYDILIFQEPLASGLRPDLEEAAALFYKLDADLRSVTEGEYGEPAMRVERIAALRPQEDPSKSNALYGFLSYLLVTHRA